MIQTASHFSTEQQWMEDENMNERKRKLSIFLLGSSNLVRLAESATIKMEHYETANEWESHMFKVLCLHLQDSSVALLCLCVWFSFLSPLSVGDQPTDDHSILLGNIGSRSTHGNTSANITTGQYYTPITCEKCKHTVGRIGPLVQRFIFIFSFFFISWIALVRTFFIYIWLKYVMFTILNTLMSERRTHSRKISRQHHKRNSEPNGWRPTTTLWLVNGNRTLNSVIKYLTQFSRAYYLVR